MDFLINSNNPLSELARTNNIFNWNNLVNHVKELPYGRNSNRTDLSLILKENKGSCSSKHAFLAAIAKENKQDNINLVLAIYKMNAENTKIGNTLTNSKLNYIPEAHCYLKINNKSFDYTSINASFDKIKDAILSEKTITPAEVSKYKVVYHHQYIKDWISKENIKLSFNEVWKYRELCIKHLSKNK